MPDFLPFFVKNLFVTFSPVMVYFLPVLSHFAVNVISNVICLRCFYCPIEDELLNIQTILLRIK